MRALSGFCIAFLFAGGMLFAQYRGSATPYITGGFGSAVFPGGTAATTPGIQRFPTIAGHPGGGGPRLNVPFSPGYRRGGSRGSGAFIYSYPFPVYMGSGFYDSSAGGYVDPNAMGPGQQPMAAAPPQGPAAPIIINIGVPTAPPAPAGPPESSFQPPAQQQSQEQEEASAPEPAHYLVAFKDHTIYSAVAYWVDGSTLHYFTSGNVHNQVSLSLVDRELTERLNKEIGMPVNLPK